MNPVRRFKTERANRIENQGKNVRFIKAANVFMNESIKAKYSYNFSWLGRPAIQYPQDIVALQEIIWAVKPDLIIETGIAHGGSLILSASMLEIIGNTGQVLGIDIDIREHNRVEIENHPMYKRIKMIQGSSIDENIVEQVRMLASEKDRVMLILDSNHTHSHVLKEMELYSSLVSTGSYMVVFDTVIEDLQDDLFLDRPWGKGNNPKTAVHQFLKNNEEFIIDRNIQDKLLVTVAPDGYLKRIK